METVDLNMEDIFDDGDSMTLEDNLEANLGPPPLPDLDADDGPMAPEAEEATQHDGDEEGAQLSRLRDLSKGAAKRHVQRPQPKLDPDRLKSERGLPSLTHLFSKVKFKGKGHEAEDLKVLMNKLEHWGHRLFPVMTFDQLLERLEKLGGKKAVQNCVKRIRLDLPILDSDFVTQYDEGGEPKVDDDDALQQRNDDDDIDLDAEAAFEEMIRQEREQQQQQRNQDKDFEDAERDAADDMWTTPRKPARRIGSDDELESPLPGTSTPTLKPGPSTPSAKPGPSTPSAKPGPSTRSAKPGPSAPTPDKSSQAAKPQELTPDQRKKMEENRRRALEKRAARLGVPVESLLPPTAPTASGSSSQPTSSTPSTSDKSQSSQPTEKHTLSQTSQETEAVSPSKTSAKNNPTRTVDDNDSEDIPSQTFSEGGNKLRRTEELQQTEAEIMKELDSDSDDDDAPGRLHIRLDSDETASKTEDTQNLELRMDTETPLPETTPLPESTPPAESTPAVESTPGEESESLKLRLESTESHSDKENLCLRLDSTEESQGEMDDSAFDGSKNATNLNNNVSKTPVVDSLDEVDSESAPLL